MDPQSTATAPAARENQPLPPVVAVVVTHDPGDWFEETLQALAAQDYPHLRVLVVDAGSTQDPSPRVTGILPEAIVHRMARNLGFGAAANEVLGMAGGDTAAFLFCHDDVAPEPAATRTLVETASDSGAGVVGPKLVGWDDPRHLLQIGTAVDKIGVTMPMVERGELDQGQHDGVREVFAVPGAFTLVRADLFARIGGFDEAISLLGDDLSLCWRARVAGDQVVVNADVTVRHREELGVRLTPKRRRQLAARHRLRVVLSGYGRLHLLRVLPQLMGASALGVVTAILSLRFSRARAAVGGWLWNLWRSRSLWAARHHVHRFRQVDDRALRRLQVPGLVHPQMRVQRVGMAAATGGMRPRALRDRAEAWCAGWTRGGAVTLVVLAAVLAMGSRHLLTRGVPAVGDLASFGQPSDLLEEWLSGWRRTGLGSDAAAPSAFGAVGALGTLLGASHVGLLRVCLTVGLIPLGVLGAARLLRPSGSPRAPVAAAVAYAVVPVPYAALAQGRWSPLAVYAAAPWLLGRLVRATRTAPYSAAGTNTSTAAGTNALTNVVATGILTALLALLAPAAPFVALTLAAGLAVGCALTLDLRGAVRVGLTGLGGVVVAALLQLPWTLEVVGQWRSPTAWLPATGSAGDVQLGDLLGLGTAASPRSALSWGLLAAAGLALLVGRGWRSTWATRAWSVAATAWVMAAVASRGLTELPFPLPSVEVFLALVGAALAMSVGLGVAAVELDVAGRSRRFGLRRMAVSLCALGFFAATVPLALGSLEGDWNMPGGDFSEVLTFVEEDAAHTSSRVLWLGEPDVLPVQSWPIAGWQGSEVTVGFATTDGLPELHDLWPGPVDGTTERVARAVELAVTQQTARLGRLLAPMAVDYVAVPQRLAPSPFTTRESPAPPELVEALAGQLDLERIDVDPAVLLFRNQAALPGRAVLPSAAAPEAEESTTTADLLRLGRDPVDAEPVLTSDQGYARWDGPVPDDVTLFQSVRASDRWVLEVDGEPAPRTTLFGWANGFEVAEGGQATLRYETPVSRAVLLGAQVTLWLMAVGFVTGQSRRARGTEVPPLVLTSELRVDQPGAESELVVVASAPESAPEPAVRSGTADDDVADAPPRPMPESESAPPATSRRRARRARKRQGPETVPEVIESVRVIRAEAGATS